MRNVRQLTRVFILYIDSRVPEAEEKDVFRSPGPISTVSFCGLSITAEEIPGGILKNKIRVVNLVEIVTLKLY